MNNLLRKGNRGKFFSKFLANYGQEIVLLSSMIILFIVVSQVNPRFLGGNNLNTIFSGNAYIGVAAIGMSILIITGNIDVSVGALIGVLATICGTLAVSGYPIWIAWFAPVVVGMIVNSIVGFIVAYAGIPSIVVTLGMMSILRGGLISVTGGDWITDMPEEFFLAQQNFLGIRVPLLTLIFLTTIMFYLMSNTTWGRSLYAIGGNSEAARTSGIDLKRGVVLAFAIHGMFVGFATILFATQLNIIASTVPPNLELTVITASVIGGVSIMGGTGTVIGSTLATILFAAIGSSLIFIGVSAYWLRAIMGILILSTVLADMARRRRASL
ncbi:MAG: ABC transporter permease [Paracoccaceae bacterium]|nr:ABC transporter permease [Paracoccaceae bacterium]